MTFEIQRSTKPPCKALIRSSFSYFLEDRQITLAYELTLITCYVENKIRSSFLGTETHYNQQTTAILQAKRPNPLFLARDNLVASFTFMIAAFEVPIAENSLFCITVYSSTSAVYS